MCAVKEGFPKVPMNPLMLLQCLQVQAVPLVHGKAPGALRASPKLAPQGAPWRRPRHAWASCRLGTSGGGKWTNKHSGTH